MIDSTSRERSLPPEIQEPEDNPVSSVELTSLVHRHFDSTFRGTKITSHTPEEFLVAVREALQKEHTLEVGAYPFTRITYIENFTDARLADVERTPDMVVHTGYRARREGELPVLVEWVEGVETEKASYLALVWYSHDQREKEHEKKYNMVSKLVIHHKLIGDWLVLWQHEVRKCHQWIQIQ